jgi:hypothetical protein
MVNFLEPKTARAMSKMSRITMTTSNVSLALAGTSFITCAGHDDRHGPVAQRRSRELRFAPSPSRCPPPHLQPWIPAHRSADIFARRAWTLAAGRC